MTETPPNRPEERAAAARAGGRRLVRWLSAFMLAVVLAGATGFVYKLVQFSREALGEETASFAAVPVLVYVCVAAGFLCLFLWALGRGQFRDVEGPKYRMLEEEEEYERAGF